MKTLLASLLLACLASPVVGADPCAQLPKPSVTVKRLDSPPELNTRYSYQALTNLGAPQARPGNEVLGLTRGQGTVHFASSGPAWVEPGSRWECASPQLTLAFGFSPLTVYVAREFAEGSCAYREIHEHELRHVKTYQAHSARIEKELTEALTARFATGSPWRGPAGQTAAMLQRELEERWVPFVQREMKRAEEAQALIDTPEEYARITNACNGEIRKRLRQ